MTYCRGSSTFSPMPTKKSSSHPRRRSTANRSEEGLGERILAALDGAKSVRAIKVSRIAAALGCARSTVMWHFSKARPATWEGYRAWQRELRA